MYRYGNTPAPQEGDYYADKVLGRVYIRNNGSWMALGYHELSAEVRAAYEGINILLDQEFSPVRPESTKVAKIVMESFLRETDEYVGPPTELPTAQVIAEPPESETP